MASMKSDLNRFARLEQRQLLYMGRVVEVNTGSYGKGGVLLPLVQLAMNWVAGVERGL